MLYPPSKTVIPENLDENAQDTAQAQQEAAARRALLPADDLHNARYGALPTRPQFTPVLNGPEDIDPDKVPPEPDQATMEAFLRRELVGTNAEDAAPSRGEANKTDARLDALEQKIEALVEHVNETLSATVNDMNKAFAAIAAALAAKAPANGNEEKDGSEQESAGKTDFPYRESDGRIS